MAEKAVPDNPIEAVHTAWRADSARLVGALTRMTRDVELAADFVQDAWWLHWNSGLQWVSRTTPQPG